MSKLIVNAYKHTGKWYHEEISEKIIKVLERENLL